jgi:hypothetical protein
MRSIELIELLEDDESVMKIIKMISPSRTEGPLYIHEAVRFLIAVPSHQEAGSQPPHLEGGWESFQPKRLYDTGLAALSP